MLIKCAANPSLTGLQALERPLKFNEILTNWVEIQKVYLLLLNDKEEQVSRNSKWHKYSGGLVTSSQTTC